MNALVDLFQQFQVDQNRRQSQKLNQEVRDFKSTYRNQEGQIKSSALILEAIWELVKERTGLEDKDLMEKIVEIDLSDGARDGKRNERATSCLGCGRKLSNRFKKCYNCGTENQNYNLFVDL